MTPLTLIYVGRHSLAGRSFKDRWRHFWVHVGIVTEQGTVIESRPFCGVVETEWAAFAARYPGLGQRQYRTLMCPDADAGIAWARSQLGKGFAYLVWLGLDFRRSWRESTRWTSAELVEMALAKAGRDRFVFKRNLPITPSRSYLT